MDNLLQSSEMALPWVLFCTLSQVGGEVCIKCGGRQQSVHGMSRTHVQGFLSMFIYRRHAHSVDQSLASSDSSPIFSRFEYFLSTLSLWY